jgi:hypothetical protein
VSRGRPTPFEQLVEQWEGAAAEWAAAFVRDPRTLELGAASLRTQLAWRRAFDAMLDAAWAPFAGQDAGQDAGPHVGGNK